MTTVTTPSRLARSRQRLSKLDTDNTRSVSGRAMAVFETFWPSDGDGARWYHRAAKCLHGASLMADDGSDDSALLSWVSQAADRCAGDLEIKARAAA